MSRVTLGQRIAWLLVALVRAAITAGIVLAVGSVGLQLYLEHAWHPADRGRQLRPPPGSLEQLQIDQHQERLAAALEVYALQEGHYPMDLTDLVESGLVAERSLRYPSFESSWFYRADGDAYVLYPPFR